MYDAALGPISHTGETPVAQVFGALVQAGLVRPLNSTHLRRGHSPPPEQSPSQALLSPSNAPTFHRKQLPRCQGGGGVGWQLFCKTRCSRVPMAMGMCLQEAGPERGGWGGTHPTGPPRTGVCSGQARLRGPLGARPLLLARGT